MSTIPSLPTYTEITHALKKTPANYNAAQVHGLLCGLICGSEKNEKKWEALIFGKKKNSKAHETLLELYETSYHQMSEFSFEFMLLLPDDKIDINIRTEALGLWCQGFLTGLEQSQIPIQNRPPGELTESLNDLIEISQVNYGDIAENEEDETAYFELVEYVRLAALMIFHELRSKKTPSHLDENNLIH